LRHRHQHPTPASNDDAQVAQLLVRAREWVALAERLAARRDRPAPEPPGEVEQRPQSREEYMAIRLRCMKAAWERRGVRWDEGRARAMLADLAMRGEVRTTYWRPVP
jgi:hypothetical protein